jgi:glycosyltransferase 2 family protein
MKKRLISIVVSIGILVLIYYRIDMSKLAHEFAQCDKLWLIVSLAMAVPITMVTAQRLQQLMPSGGDTRLSFGEANGLILSASVLNMVLPSKMGDIAKSYFMAQRGHLPGALALSLVIFEKACDMLSLLLWCVLGLVLYENKDARFWTMTAVIVAMFLLLALLLGSLGFARVFLGTAARFAPGKMKAKFANLRASWEEMHHYFWADKGRLARVTFTSVFLWFLHLLQIWMFTKALRADVPVLTNLALAPLAILAGLLPLTFAGVGTRDAALVAFYSPKYMTKEAAAALGILCTSRYLLPALAGLPFLSKYMPDLSTLKRAKAEAKTVTPAS